MFIEKLPTCLDRDSIRVEGVGNAVIFDVVYHPPPVVNPNTTKPEERAKLKEVEQRIATLQSEKKIREDQSDVLDGYAKTMNAEKSDAKALIGFLDLFSQRKRDIHENVQAIGNQIEEVEKEAEELRKLLWEDAGSMGRKAKISVIALAATDGKASLLVSYGTCSYCSLVHLLKLHIYQSCLEPLGPPFTTSERKFPIRQRSHRLWRCSTGLLSFKTREKTGMMLS